MLKRTIIGALIAVPFFLNLVFSVTTNYTNLSDSMVKSLCNDIVLTDSQKVVIQAKAKDYALKIQNISQMPNDSTRSTFQKQVVLGYRAVLDSVLTKSQKDSLYSKRINRMKSQNN